MNELKIYWTSIEFELKDSHPDFNKYKGGFVYAFVKTNDSESALDKYKKALDRNDLVGFDFEYIKPYEDIEWEKEEEQKHFDKLFQEASKSNVVILDDFYMYKQRD